MIPIPLFLAIRVVCFYISVTTVKPRRTKPKTYAGKYVFIKKIPIVIFLYILRGIVSVEVNGIAKQKD